MPEVVCSTLTLFPGIKQLWLRVAAAEKELSLARSQVERERTGLQRNSASEDVGTLEGERNALKDLNQELVDTAGRSVSTF